jgi:hypothetical protein
VEYFVMPSESRIKPARAPWLRAVLIAALVVAPVHGVRAQDAPPAVDPAIDLLLQVDPAALVARVAALKGEADQQTQEAVALRGQADALDQQVAGLQLRLDTLTAQVKALGMSLGVAGDTAAMAAAAPSAEVMPAEMPAESRQPDQLPRPCSADSEGALRVLSQSRQAQERLCRHQLCAAQGRR